jgi:hypothetical protein
MGLLKLLIKKIERKNSVKKMALLVFSFVILEVIFSFVLIPQFSDITGGGEILDMKLFYNYQQAQSTIESYGPQGIKFYTYIQLVDLLFPLAYSLMFSLLLSRLITIVEISGKIKMVILIPFIAALADYFENLGIFIMLRQHPGDYYLTAKITSVLTIVKFAAFGGFITAALLLVGFIIKNRLQTTKVGDSHD